MKKTLAVLLFAAVPAVAQESEIVKGLVNLRDLHRMATSAEVMHAGGMHAREALVDPWGTPYRVESKPGFYRIVGAGSDKAFDETSWASRTQFEGLEGDIVIESARIVRSNRNWLYEQVKNDAERSALDTLRQSELDLMLMQTPNARSSAAVKGTALRMEIAGSTLKSGREFVQNPRDAWGTPLRIEGDATKYRIISAGADRQFDEASWTRAATPSANEDLIYENGAFTRRLNENDLLRDVTAFVPVAQPPDPAFAEDGPYQRVGGDVKAPVALTRVEPKYPETYRRARLSGIVILAVAISATGRIDDARLIKSLAPDLDAAALDAVRKWTFSPATREGAPVPSIFNLTINFKLK